MFLLLAHAALAADEPATPAPAKTHTPAPREERTVEVVLMWANTIYPNAATVDGEPLGCPIPCTAHLSPGEHEMTVTVGEDSQTFLIDVPKAARHVLVLPRP